MHDQLHSRCGDDGRRCLEHILWRTCCSATTPCAKRSRLERPRQVASCSPTLQGDPLQFLAGTADTIHVGGRNRPGHG
jgi:hypothetical protein